MILRKALLMATVLLLSAPVVPALAHDDEDNGYNSHDQFHDQLSGAHERAHEYGFYSRGEHRQLVVELIDRKSTRLNSSHQIISYAVFCLKKKNYCVVDSGRARDVLDQLDQ